MYGVGIILLRKHFQNCIVLVRQGSFLCQRWCISLMGGFIGTFSSVVHHKIGSQNHLIFFGLCFIPQMCRAVLLKARFSSKLEAPWLQRFLPQKLGSFKEAHFRHAFCALSKSSKRTFWRFFIFFKKKKNQNWNKTLGSWHYWYKRLIWHVFSVTYLSKKDILSVTCPKRLKPNPQPPSSSLCPHILSSFMEKKKSTI